MTDRPVALLADTVHDLVRPRTHLERFELQALAWRPEPAPQYGGPPGAPASRGAGRAPRPVPAAPGPRMHPSRHPSLLDQLRAAGAAGSPETGGTSGGYESRPAARLDALDRLTAIEQAVDDWLVRLLDVEPRAHLEDQLRQLVGLETDLEPDQQVRLGREAERWLTWARVVTGWDGAPWRPNAPCPMCERTGGLRVRLSEHAAACLDCGEAWAPDTIGLLADHLRGLEADAESARRQLTRLRSALDGHFPYRGPCLCADCTAPGAVSQDARHRLLDAVAGSVLNGHPDGDIAAHFGLPLDAVRTVAALTTWPTDDELAPAMTG